MGNFNQNMKELEKSLCDTTGNTAVSVVMEDGRTLRGVVTGIVTPRGAFGEKPEKTRAELWNPNFKVQTTRVLGVRYMDTVQSLELDRSL